MNWARLTEPIEPRWALYWWSAGFVGGTLGAWIAAVIA